MPCPPYSNFLYVSDDIWFFIDLLDFSIRRYSPCFLGFRCTKYHREDCSLWTYHRGKVLYHLPNHSSSVTAIVQVSDPYTTDHWLKNCTHELHCLLFTASHFSTAACTGVCIPKIKFKPAEGSAKQPGTCSVGQASNNAKKWKEGLAFVLQINKNYINCW